MYSFLIPIPIAKNPMFIIGLVVFSQVLNSYCSTPKDKSAPPIKNINASNAREERAEIKIKKYTFFLERLPTTTNIIENIYSELIDQPPGNFETLHKRLEINVKLNAKSNLLKSLK